VSQLVTLIYVAAKGLESHSEEIFQPFVESDKGIEIEVSTTPYHFLVNNRQISVDSMRQRGANLLDRANSLNVPGTPA
jgi:hypothetical protein